VCVAGTRWVQKELLDKYPHANLKVYAVWFSMMPNDSRAKWSGNLLTDSRVIHRWDEPKVVGTWFAPRTDTIRPQLAPDSAWGKGDVLWDAYLLYGADARWDEAPSGLIHWGRTIVAGRETLKGDFDKLFAVKK
jgi:hypothetical protein